MSGRVAALGLRRSAPLPRAARIALGILARLRFGRLEVVGPGGQRYAFPGALPGPDACLELADWEVLAQTLAKGDIGFAETYIDGRWSTPDLAALLTLAALNNAALAEAIHGRWWGKLYYRLRHLLRANTHAGSRRNIHAHYDLGNAFYARWLDATMTYSAALFGDDAAQSLEDAQTAKYERILQRIRPRADQRILEIGCGWGGFAEYAARTRSCAVHGVTVSQRQLEYAQARIARAGLSRRVALSLCDYRDLTGRFDHVVSIEMYEAVGERYWPAYFDTIARRLAPGGLVLLQAITIADERFERYRRSTDFIQQYVFPGGMLASPRVLDAQARRAGLVVRDRFRFGQDYAQTLRRWATRFDSGWPELHAAGFDLRFKRLWNFYLAYCEAGFRAGTTDVMQVEMSHA
jgi:cyclopropane-fatty-acyl-phospholipid synthase